jgi:hypothetical protein
MVSAKFFDDKYYNNAYYARVGGVSAKEMNAMELEFLYLVNFKLHVTPDVFQQYRDELITSNQQPPSSPTTSTTPNAVGFPQESKMQKRL